MTYNKILLGMASVGLLFLGVPPISHGKASRDPSQNQTQKATKSVSGKVASIGDGGKSFVVEVSSGDSAKQSMQFVVDKNTQVEGHVTTGTAVVVEYQPMDGDQNLCVKISVQQG